MGMGSIPDQGTKIRHATWHGKDRNKSDTEQWVNMLTVRVATRKMESIEQEKRGGVCVCVCVYVFLKEREKVCV